MYLNGSEYLVDKILEMKEKGITQREAAERLDISESKVSRILKRTRNIV
jgi:DNA-directed RNA polymerase specialized sigma subunit